MYQKFPTLNLERVDVPNAVKNEIIYSITQSFKDLLTKPPQRIKERYQSSISHKYEVHH